MMKKATPALLAAALLLSSLPSTALAGGSPTTLPDVTGHWAESEIRTAAAAGWVNGYPDGTFKPDGNVTRAEFLKMLSMVRGGNPGREIGDQRLAAFSPKVDEQSHWAVTGGFVKNALAQGVLEPSDYPIRTDANGEISAWTLGPDTPLTRLDAAILVGRALGNKYQAESFWYHPGSVYSLRRDEPKGYYQDQVAPWAKGWVASATESGIMKGYPDGTFQAGQRVKRSEAVIMLQRMAQKEATPWRPTAMVEAPRTPGMLNRDGLYYLTFTPVLTLRFDLGANWDETAATWASFSRAYRAKVVESYTRQLWDQVKGQTFFPLAVRHLIVNIEGQPNQGLGEGHFDGVTYEYLDARGMDEPANPATGIDLEAHLSLATTQEELEAQYVRSLDNAKVNYEANPPQPAATYIFPYQYLSDWFRMSAPEGLAFAQGRADDLYTATRARLEAIGLPPQPVTVHIAPADTAGRAGQYRALLIGETLVRNPVLTVTYDGETMTVGKQAESFQGYVDGLKPYYEWIPAGEAGGEERVDPAPDAARQMMKTFLYSLGLVRP
ncbi:MAG TPA: S-layer homology domain-containing protein [Symbiobacteriaceae bacterium]|nr:S-layer homology domain-containing protein [Symbiobacteriaceae bacterium]